MVSVPVENCSQDNFVVLLVHFNHYFQYRKGRKKFLRLSFLSCDFHSESKALLNNGRDKLQGRKHSLQVVESISKCRTHRQTRASMMMKRKEVQNLLLFFDSECCEDDANKGDAVAFCYFHLHG